MDALRDRFETHPERHPGVAWADVERSLGSSGLRSLTYLEETGGEPDVLLFRGHLYLADFSPESPQCRSVCYDHEARLGRKRNPPSGSACELAEANGLDLVGEDMYLAMQELLPLDEKTSSWLTTPETIRKRGGAIFGNRRYGRAFVYCNSADSYYAARGFRACLPLE